MYRHILLLLVLVSLSCVCTQEVTDAEQGTTEQGTAEQGTANASTDSNTIYYEAIKDYTFETIKSDQTDKFVVFYKSDDLSNIPVLHIINNAAKIIAAESPNFYFVKCDGSLEINIPDYTASGFNEGIFLFTSTNEGGIQRFNSEINVDNIVKHVRSINIPITNPEIVKKFTTKDNLESQMSSTGKPVFMKYYIDTCVHCKNLKTTFQRFAHYFDGKVDFMEINCQSDADSTAYCNSDNAHSYPTLYLIDGANKVKYEEPDRGFLSIEKFFNKNIPHKVGSAEIKEDL